MNRKGDLFLLGITIFFLIALLLIFSMLSNAFRQENPGEGLGARQVALLHTYGVSEQMLLYLDTVAGLAAQDAADELLAQGGLNPIDSACGTYVGAEAWSAPGKTCFPTRSAIDDAFAAKLRSALRTRIRFPGFPPVAYAIIVEHAGAKLRIIGIAQDTIELPIVIAKDASQEDVTDAILHGNVIRAHRSDAADSPLARMEPSPNFAERAHGNVREIIIHAGDASAPDLLYRMTSGGASTHYLIDERGGIVQLVSEDRKAFHCRSCADRDDASIGVTLAGAARCWDEHPQQQLQALDRLLADIVHRRGLAPKDVLFEEQITGSAACAKDQQAMYASTLEKLAQGEAPAPAPAQERQQFAIARPAESEVVTSCWGVRDRIGDHFHDGVDFRGHNAPVFAFADGTVYDTCTGHCSGYGQNVILKHSDSFFTQYNHLNEIRVRRGDKVARGSIIGLSGNTGASKAPHLDFKAYTSEGDLPGKRSRPDTGKNPLCFFPEEELRQLALKPGGNCVRYTENGLPGLTHANPVLQKECDSIVPMAPAAACGIGTVPASANGNAKLASTIENLERYNLLRAIQETAERNDLDPRLIIAVIAQESGGNPYAVNPGGDVGLGQISPVGYQDNTDIFGGGFRQDCRCEQGDPGYPVCDGRALAKCAGDPRLDPQKNIQATGKHLSRKLSHSLFNGLAYREHFGIAAYNTGEGNVKKALDKAPGRDPTWGEVAPHLHTITQAYVPSVLALYAAQGGSAGGMFSDQRCAGITVKEVGRYAFTPSFTAMIDDPFGQVEAVVAFAKSAYAACDGRGGHDTRACLGERLAAFDVQGAKIVACEEDAAALAKRLEEFIEDCESNMQDDCACQWHPRPLERDVRLRLYGDRVQWLSDDAAGPVPYGAPVVQYRAGDDAQIAERSVELALGKDGLRQLVTWESIPGEEGADAQPFSERLDTAEVQLFSLVKEDGRLIWSSDTDLPACGIRKTAHRVCVSLGQETLRFALHLEDKHPPERVGKLCAANAELYNVPLLVAVAFDPSPSEDVSYYEISCGPAGGLATPVTSIVPGRRYAGYADVPQDGQQLLQLRVDKDCGGIPGVTKQYEIAVTPYDVSGNKGEPVRKTTGEKEQSLLDAATGGAAVLLSAVAACS